MNIALVSAVHLQSMSLSLRPCHMHVIYVISGEQEVVDKSSTMIIAL